MRLLGGRERGAALVRWSWAIAIGTELLFVQLVGWTRAVTARGKRSRLHGATYSGRSPVVPTRGKLSGPGMSGVIPSGKAVRLGSVRVPCAQCSTRRTDRLVCLSSIGMPPFRVDARCMAASVESGIGGGMT